MTTILRRLARQLRALVHRDSLNRDVDAEMRMHLELEAEQLVRDRGLAPEEARRQAALAFGGVDRYAEAHHDARGVRWLEEVAQDARYSARALRRAPGFTITATIVLALGVGASTAIFSAVDAVLVSRLPYRDDHRLVRIYQQNSPTNRFGTSVVDYQAIVAQQRSFDAVGAVQRRDAAIQIGPTARRGTIALADAGFFAALGVRANRGRLIGQGDSASDRFVATVAYDFAAREFGGDGSRAIGKTVTIDGVSYTIVGVLEPEHRDLAGVRANVWSSLVLGTPERRGPFGLRVIARLKDDVTLEAATRDLAGVSERIFPQWASSFQDRTARLTPYDLRTTLLGNAGQTLGLFVAAVALVLLIAVANVASLTLVRVTSRSRETVLRTVLGASSTRVARLLVTESLVLSALGAVAGALIAPTLLDVLGKIGPPIPRLIDASIDLRAIAFAAALAVVTGLLVGVYPAIALFRRDFSSALRSGDREIGASRSMHLLRGALVTAQFALALPVLATAALLLNSFIRLQRVDAGFDPRSLAYVHVSLPPARYDAPEKAAAFWNRAFARLVEEPGIVAAGIGDPMPPDEPSDINNFDLVDRPVAPGDAQPTSPYAVVDPGFFRAVGIPLVEGRTFTDSRYGHNPARDDREPSVGTPALLRSLANRQAAAGRRLHDVSAVHDRWRRWGREVPGTERQRRIDVCAGGTELVADVQSLHSYGAWSHRRNRSRSQCDPQHRRNAGARRRGSARGSRVCIGGAATSLGDVVRRLRDVGGLARGYRDFRDVVLPRHRSPPRDRRSRRTWRHSARGDRDGRGARHDIRDSRCDHRPSGVDRRSAAIGGRTVRRRRRRPGDACGGHGDLPRRRARCIAASGPPRGGGLAHGGNSRGIRHHLRCLLLAGAAYCRMKTLGRPWSVPRVSPCSKQHQLTVSSEVRRPPNVPSS